MASKSIWLAGKWSSSSSFLAFLSLCLQYWCKKCIFLYFTQCFSQFVFQPEILNCFQWNWFFGWPLAFQNGLLNALRWTSLNSDILYNCYSQNWNLITYNLTVCDKVSISSTVLVQRAPCTKTTCFGAIWDINIIKKKTELLIFIVNQFKLTFQRRNDHSQSDSGAKITKLLK
jgi:hypothetical protein